MNILNVIGKEYKDLKGVVTMSDPDKKGHPAIQPDLLEAHDGFVISKDEQQAVIELLAGKSGPLVLERGTPFKVPENHPLSGKAISYPVLKDTKENIYVINTDALLGKGANGKVFVAQIIHVGKSSHGIQGEFCAAKIQYPKGKKDLKKMQAEDEIAKVFNLTIDSCFSGSSYYAMMPLFQGKEVSKLVASYYGNFDKEGNPKENNAAKEYHLLDFLNLFERTAAAVDEIHQKGILHLDLKPENIMYDEKSEKVTIFDFGNSKKISDNLAVPCEEAIGTPYFMAPEFYDSQYQEKLSTAQDIFALGRTLELSLYGYLRALDANMYQSRLPAPHLGSYLKRLLESPYLTEANLRHEPPTPEVMAINRLMQLIRAVRDPNPQVRPSATEIKENLMAIRKDYVLAKKQENLAEFNAATQLAKDFLNQLKDRRNQKDLKIIPGGVLTQYQGTERHKKQEELAMMRELIYESKKINDSIKNNQLDAPAIYKKLHQMISEHAVANGNKTNQLCLDLSEKINSKIQSEKRPSIKI